MFLLHLNYLLINHLYPTHVLLIQYLFIYFFNVNVIKNFLYAINNFYFLFTYYQLF